VTVTGFPPVVVAASPAAPLASAARAGVDVSRIATANEATAARLIEAGDVDEVTHVLAGLDNGRAAARLNKTAPERVALVLAAMDEQAAANIARQMAQSVVAAAFEAMPPAEAERILARISFDRQAAILHPLKATAAAAILQQMADWPTFLGDVHNLAPSDLVRF
jgi:Mg/Co/Ni transporter MgtE